MVRFFRMKGEKNQTARDFLKDPYPSNSASTRHNQTDNDSSQTPMEVDSDFMKMKDLKYPSQVEEAIEAVQNDQYQQRMRLKIRTRTQLPVGDIWRLFSDAIKNNNLSKIIQLVRIRNHDPNILDKHHRTPLHMASAAGHFLICEFLLINGADPNKQDVIGNTPLHLAACSSRLEIVNLLLENGANCDIQDGKGFSAPMLAQAKLRMICTSARKNPDSYDDLKKKYTDVFQMLHTWFANKNIVMSQLNAIQSSLNALIFDSDKSNCADNDSDINDLLSSISALSIDPNGKASTTSSQQ